ncbi:hypothetical protein LY90DRAFT_516785 [Neocallimastix californiae]|uniref:FLYWCH-type domain-containing protein n=1 Tax=Neocallimastix californiae TaxID=1754190 RepID=A0A1Y2AD65_9FUNG|nr:hypothetical protein LY90DRAFT_516785 [Neocallimastix californiae]|eukprot:ORY20446.1 hypothetical protein LY90DRAFT_516785 [Neocallimastix californiae]
MYGFILNVHKPHCDIHYILISEYKSKIYRCTEYKTLNKCKSLIILNDKKEVLKYESLHNHLKKEIDVSISLAKHKIKEEIKKNSIPMDIKPKHIFNAVSQEMGLICPEYNTIRSQIIRNINKQFPPNIKGFDDIPIESEYYKMKRNENFMIFKNTDLCNDLVMLLTRSL